MPTFAGFTRVLRSMLLEDWWLKLSCLGLAVLMWFYIDAELTDQSDFQASLRLADIEIPNGWEISGEAPIPKFSVRLRGPRRRLQLFNAESIVIRKQAIANPQQGRNPISVGPGDVEVEGLEVVSVMPKDEKGAAVTLISTTKRLKRVRVKTTGRPASKFVVDTTITEPDQVNVEGPSDDLDQVEFVTTEEVDINDAEQDVVRDVGILPYSDVSGRRIFFRCTATVRATVKIQPEQVTRKMTLEIRPLALAGTAMTIEPKAVEVEVQADEQLFSPDFSSNVFLFVEWPKVWDVPKDSSTVLGPIDVPVRVSAPSRVRVTGEKGGPLPTVKVRGVAATKLTK